MIIKLIIVILLATQIHSAIKIQNQKFLDSQGRELQIKGGCVIVKVPPYFPNVDSFDSTFSFSDRDIEIFKEMGYNGVRLGAMWAGIQPTKDTYNETYLEALRNLVNKLGENGIYTLLDFHQDILSEKFCGDGVPIWLMDQINGYKTFPIPVAKKKIPLNQSGLPDWSNCSHPKWGQYYFSDDVGRGFNHLYDLNHKLNHKFTAFWRKVASYFVNNPYVIAYELINEPFVGDAIRNPFLLTPRVADRFKFQKFYDNLAHNIREIDPKANICFQPITFDFKFQTGFTHPPGGKKYQNQSILCYHYESPPVKSLKTLDAKLKDSKRLKIPVLMSQFGGGVGNKPTREFVQDHLQSYFYWQYKQFGKGWGSSNNQRMFKTHEDDQLGTLVNPNGTLDETQVKYHARTCLQNTAGHLSSSIYRHETGYFNAVYEPTPKGTSILYMNKNVVYKKGYTLDVIPRELVEISHNGNYIEITYLGKQQEAIVPIMITINRLSQ